MPTTEAPRSSNQGWLTLHEALEITGLPYARLMALVEQHDLPVRQSGAAKLYDPEAVELIAVTAERA